MVLSLINPQQLIATLTSPRCAINHEHRSTSRTRLSTCETLTDTEAERPIGRLYLDASYSPVRKVAYSVESARVEQRTDLDKLVIDIETNGTL